jgi:hypothetical protein
MMETGASTLARVQAVSQGWWQIRPQMPGKGCSLRNSSKASLYLPWAIRAMQPWKLGLAGQVVLQGAVPFFSMA